MYKSVINRSSYKDSFHHWLSNTCYRLNRYHLLLQIYLVFISGLVLIYFHYVSKHYWFCHDNPSQCALRTPEWGEEQPLEADLLSALGEVVGDEEAVVVPLTGQQRSAPDDPQVGHGQHVRVDGHDEQVARDLTDLGQEGQVVVDLLV